MAGDMFSYFARDRRSVTLWIEAILSCFATHLQMTTIPRHDVDVVRYIYCCTKVSPLPSRIHVSGLGDIWHMSLSLNIGNVVTYDTIDLSLPTDLVL
jgi:hypothetical protein